MILWQMSPQGQILQYARLCGTAASPPIAAASLQCDIDRIGPRPAASSCSKIRALCG
jgi:hypothetical protein